MMRFNKHGLPVLDPPRGQRPQQPDEMEQASPLADRAATMRTMARDECFMNGVLA